MAASYRNRVNKGRCKTCGYRERGPNHAQGDHHKKSRPVTPADKAEAKAKRRNLR